MFTKEILEKLEVKTAHRIYTLSYNANELIDMLVLIDVSLTMY